MKKQRFFEDRLRSEEAIIFLFMKIYHSVLFCIIGCLMGSFCDCMAYRYVRKDKDMGNRSCCEYCGHVLSVGDLIPVLSFVMLKGRCRYCGERIDPRHVLVELFCGIVFVLFYLRYGICFLLFRDLFLVSILVILSLIDMDTYTLPDLFILLGVFDWLVFCFFIDEKSSYLCFGLLGGLFISLVVYLLYLSMFLIYKKEGMGLGDVKFLFMVGLYTGVYGSLKVLFIASVIGLFAMLWGKRKMIPFGPFIAFGTMIVLLFVSV